MKHNLAPLKEQLKKAHEMINAATADLIEMSTKRQTGVQKKKEARANKEPDAVGPIAGEEEALVLKQKVNEMTRRLEEKTRLVIDMQTMVEAGETQRKEVSRTVTAGNGRVEILATQSTLGASQFRSRRNRVGGEEDADEDEEEDEDGEHSQQAGTGIVKALKRKADEHEATYKALSMSDR
jgi:hypothetical protein